MMVMPKEEVTKAEVEKQSERLKRSHIFLMKHPKIMPLSGIIVMGKSEVKPDIPTAYTDGRNKRYGAKFMKKLTDPQVNGLVMHENGHVFCRHVSHHKRIFRENPKLANIAADLVVNDMIVRYEDKQIELPPGALWNPMFRNWSAIEVYDYLKKRKKELEDEDKGEGGNGPKGNTPSGGSNNESKNGQEPTDIDEMLKNLDDHDSLDEHDTDGEADDKELGEEIDRALRQGGMLAGILGGKRDRAIEELLAPVIDWRETLREFISAICNGKDEYSWRRFDRRHVANDMYLPSTISERVGEIIVAIDTSGSIDEEQLSHFAGELASICESVTPDKIRVVWWDATVHGEQIFTEGQYANVASLLKPVGGGGTRVSCVSDYLVKQGINAECVIVFTDGYVENDIVWEHTAPLLWLITHNKNFEPPVGKSVHMKED